MAKASSQIVDEARVGKDGTFPDSAPPDARETTWAEKVTPSDVPELAGTLLGERYQIQRFLAKGGMGVVYAGHHVVLRTDIAIKIVQLSDHVDAEERFLREARLACTVRHPNLVQIMDCGMLPDGRGYLIMELLHGQTLAASLTSGPMDVLRVCAIAAQIARGLLAIHERGIVHCDMKPRNVLLIAQDEHEDCVKIVDFGIAKPIGTTESGQGAGVDRRVTGRPPVPPSQRPQRSPQASTGTLAGTPEYMSPEQCQGLRLDGRSDMYSLGCMLYEMLSGKVPFSGAMTADVLDAHMTAPVPPLRAQPAGQPISRSLEALVLRMLAKDPALRFPSMHEVERELRREADLLRIQRGEQVMWERDHLLWLVQRHARARQPGLGNSPLLRRMIAFIIALMSVRLGSHMRPVLPPAPPLPSPPRIEALAPQPPRTLAVPSVGCLQGPGARDAAVSACRSPRRSDTVPATASPAGANAQPPGPRAR